MKNDKPFDIDLGDGHWLRWSTYQGERCGGIIRHVMPNERGFCEGAFWLRDSSFIRAHDDGTKRPQWDLTGTEESPTLTPSFQCHCGDHGFVTEGKWVRA